MTFLAALAAALASAAGAAEPTAAQWLARAVAPAGYESLQSGRYIVVQGEAGQERLEYVDWKALEQLVHDAPLAQAFVEADGAHEAGKPLPPSTAELAPLSQLPPGGLMTPSLQTAAQSLLALSQDLAALGSTGTVQDLLAVQPALFDTGWGRAFAARYGPAGAGQAAQALAGVFFQEELAGPQRDEKAQAHFLDYARRRFSQSLSAPLAQDERAGRLSPPVRAALERYLGEQAILLEAERLDQGLSALERQRAFRAQRAALQAAAEGLVEQPALLQELETRAGPSAPAVPRPSLTGSALHVQAPIRLHQYELGDQAAVSGAYWVDGLGDGEKAAVEETTFLETPSGVRALDTRRVKRADGGPYAFSRRIELHGSRDVVFHALISAEGSNTLSEKAIVPVSSDFETALQKLAAADAAALSCRFKDAGYAQLASELEGAAGQKRQYRDLRDAALSRANEAARHAAALEQAEGLIADSHVDLSTQTCRYDDTRTLRAAEAVRLLPAGCDHYLPGLLSQLAAIRRRAADQDAFDRAARAARERLKDCEFSAAADKAEEALALLDADPEARCGGLDAQARALEPAAARAQTGELWRARFEAALDRGEKASSPDERLAAARQVLARIGTLPDAGCYAQERGRAQQLAQAAGEALAPPEKTRLPDDDDLPETLARVSAQRRSLQEPAEARSPDAEQAPSAAPAPAPQAERQTATKGKKPRRRLSHVPAR